MKQKWKLAIGILIFLTVASGIFLYSFFLQVGAFLEETYKPIDSNSKNQAELAGEEEGQTEQKFFTSC